MLHAKYMAGNPEVGDGGIPGAWDGGKRGKEKTIKSESDEIRYGERYRKKEDLSGRKGIQSGERRHRSGG